MLRSIQKLFLYFSRKERFVISEGEKCPWGFGSLGEYSFSYINPLTGLPYSAHLDYLAANSLHISETAIFGKSGDFEHSNEYGSIRWVKRESRLEINGIVYVDADVLDIGDKGETRPILRTRNSGSGAGHS